VTNCATVSFSSTLVTWNLFGKNKRPIKSNAVKFEKFRALHYQIQPVLCERVHGPKSRVPHLSSRADTQKFVQLRCLECCIMCRREANGQHKMSVIHS
jgi:hypothetical protein